MTSGRVLRALFVAYLAATAVHIALIMAHEPFAYDAWNIAVDTHAEPFTWSRFLGYGVFEYTHSNPRIGQWLTYLAYKLEWFAPIATPIAYLAFAYAITALGLGRWPRRGRELALFAIAIGYAWFAIPRIGMIMFCRAYGANYLYGAVIQLWFVLPLRLRPAGTGSRRACIAYGVLGVLAGMANEHTGPTLILFVLGYTLWRERLWRRREAPERPWLAWAGTIGVIVGFAAIFFAPGQASRYDGLATKVSLLGRLLQRGVINNLDIFRDWLVGCAPVLGLLAIVVIVARNDVGTPRDGAPARWPLDPPLRLFGYALIAGSLVTATVFVSPKLGPRFFMHGCALVLAAFIAVADHALTTRRRLIPLVVLAVAASVYAGVRTLPLYFRVSEVSDQRIADLKVAAPGSVYTAEAFDQVEDSWWFLGDDFRDPKKRELVSAYFGLRDVVLRSVDIEAPLGVSDVQLVPRYQISPASCLDQYGGIDLGIVRGLDITSIHHAMLGVIDRLRDRLAHASPPGALERLDFVVDFQGTPPPLPRPRLVVGRWLPSGFEVHAGLIERRGASRTRQVKLPKELVDTDYEIYVYPVGGEARRLGTARDAKLEYSPWQRGAYWALACHPDECFVIATARVL